MRETPQDIIPDTEIAFVHAYANFGVGTKRGVVNDGVLKYAFGFTSGSTQLAILLKHRLIHTPKTGSYSSILTKKGVRYLRAVFWETVKQATKGETI